MLDQSQGDGKREAGIKGLFSGIAPVYDLLNSVMSLGMHKRWRRLCVKWAGVKRGDKALDVCCGSGDFAFALAERTGSEGEVAGLDFSAPMLEVARSKAVRRGLQWVEFVEGNALSLPFEDEHFDTVTVGYGLRNVVDLPGALLEMVRVAKPGGSVVNLEIMGIAAPLLRPLWRLYFNRLTPLVARLFGGDKAAYDYLPCSVERFLTVDQMREEMEKAGLVEVVSRPFVFGAVCAFIGRKKLG